VAISAMWRDLLVGWLWFRPAIREQTRSFRLRQPLQCANSFRSRPAEGKFWGLTATFRERKENNTFPLCVEFSRMAYPI